MKIKCLTIYIIIFSKFAFSSPQNKKLDLEEFCKTYTGQDDFLKELSTQVLKQNKRRSELVQLMKNNRADGCKEAITDYLNNFINNNKNEDTRGLDAYLLLAFAAKLPVVTKLIEKEIDKGHFIEWLDILLKEDKEAYFNALSNWIKKVAFVARQVEQAGTVDEKFYGKSIKKEDETLPPESIPTSNPIFINKYMDFIIKEKRKLTKEEFSYLNIIYAASNQSYRDVFLNQMSAVVSLSIPAWLGSFRREPVWIQFRLFPVMKKVGGGYIKSELIWLSKYHENFKIKALAGNTLEKINFR